MSGIEFDAKTYTGKVLNNAAVGTDTSPLALPVNEPRPCKRIPVDELISIAYCGLDTAMPNPTLDKSKTNADFPGKIVSTLLNLFVDTTELRPRYNFVNDKSGKKSIRSTRDGLIVPKVIRSLRNNN